MWILSPLSWLLVGLLALAAGAMLPSRRHRRRLQWTGTAGIAIALLAMTPAVANLLVAWLEQPPEQPAACGTRPPEVAIVLAGGVDRVPASAEDISALNVGSRRRAEQAVDWWRGASGRRLVVAGGSRRRHGVPEAAIVAGYMRRFGVPAGSIRIESRSLDTWQNARNVASLDPAEPRDVVLVTSAMHMRRARYAMEQAGFRVCTLSADPRHVPFRRLGYLFPDSGGLQKTEAALHELVGFVAYRARQRGDGAQRVGDPPAASRSSPPPPP